MRKLAGVLMLCCASMALAQGLSREGARGMGIAENAEGKKARFAFVANKVTSGDRVAVGGNLELNVLDRDARRAVAVGLPMVKRLGVNGRAAEFGGPGFLAITEGRNIRRIPGNVVAVVRDLGVPTNDEDDADTIAVRFVPQNPENRSFAFEGELVNGDLAVFPRQ